MSKKAKQGPRARKQRPPEAKPGLKGNILITGGTGTLGSAIIKQGIDEGWDCRFTVFSRDPVKQAHMERAFPSVRYVLGDIRDFNSLHRAMVGHHTVIHAAAQKHIPQGEANPTDCIEINVIGSQNVANAALQAKVVNVIGISTDKVCEPWNVYGATKMAMERIFREYNALGLTRFKLCRYGNVLGSNGSVLQLWDQQLANGLAPTITDPEMTRFWITEETAVGLVLLAYEAPPGSIVIPLAPALPMAKFARYLLGEEVELNLVGRRPGEKMHETLLASYEATAVQAKEDHLYCCTARPLMFTRAALMVRFGASWPAAITPMTLGMN